MQTQFPPAAQDALAAVAAVDLVKVYGSGDTAVRALDGVTVGFTRAQFTAIMGPSGSGKSTLMHCLAGLDTATAGQALLGGTDLTRQSDRVLTKVRRERIGFIFQSFNLLPQLTAEQNILLGLELAGRKPDKQWFDTIVNVLGLRDRLTHRPTELSALSKTDLTLLRRDRLGFVFQAFNLLPTLTALENITLPFDLAGRRPDPAAVRSVVDVVRLGDRLDHRPSQLSGGQQQRVAVARALISRPEVVFADEPTGNLDSRSGAEVLQFLRNSVRELGQTVVMVTHDPGAASYADRVVLLADGKVAGDIDRPDHESVTQALRSLAVQR